MSRARPFYFFLFRLLPFLVLGLLGARAMAQGDPPSRVARLNYLEGAAVFAPAGDNEWIDAVLNRPLTRGDRVWTDKGSRADLQVGSSAVRMDGQAHLEILALDDRSTQLSVTQGTVYVRVRSLPEGENFEIDTPNLAYRAAYPGDYRIDVNANTGTTRVTIHSGTGAVYGESGQVLALGGGQQITFRLRDLSQMAAQESPPQDNFDRWAADRNRREDQAVSARYVPREVVGYQQLDAHGRWTQDATYGPVWFPQGMAANWAPYRNGHWEWISPWGWTWIDAAAWGFAPFHYGRWAMIDSRWAWVPGHIALKPVYSPALVAFIGAPSGGINWFPLAPGEAWQPGYAASPSYLKNVNGDQALQANSTYAHQYKPEALTSISAEDFHRGRPVRASWLRVAANTLTNAQIVPPPPMPERSVIAQRKPAPVARALPPAAPKVQVAAASVPSASPVEVPKQEQPPAKKAAKAADSAKAEPKTVQPVIAPQAPAAAATASPAAPTVQAKPAEQPRAPGRSRLAEKKLAEAAKAEQAKADEDKRDKIARRAEQTRREQMAKRAEPAKREQLARAEQARREQQVARQAEQARRDQQVAKQAEQTRREQQLAKQAELAKRAELARRELVNREVAKREQARRELIARKAEQAKRDALAKREEQARREAIARRDEQQRREAHARQVDQARRAADREAQALREQREQREELQARREAQEREQAQQREQAAQRAAWARQQQALGERWRRDQQAWEQQQRERARQRPDLRNDGRPRTPELQRGIPVISGPWS